MNASTTYTSATVARPVATQPVAVELPADINLASLKQLLNSQPVPMRLRVELPHGTRLLDLQRFAHREGLVLTYSDNLIRCKRPEPVGLLQRARNFIFQPLCF